MSVLQQLLHLVRFLQLQVQLQQLGKLPQDEEDDLLEIFGMHLVVLLQQPQLSLLLNPQVQKLHDLQVLRNDAFLLVLTQVVELEDLAI